MEQAIINSLEAEGYHIINIPFDMVHNTDKMLMHRDGQTLYLYETLGDIPPLNEGEQFDL